jgi:MerR family transcriptional regulator, light-induced transcriptional regulator
MKQQEFSIKELESFSGIKAHTIRIWEQRYGILVPERSDTNIRKYTDKDLKILLNVSLLNNLGHKISAIAKMSEDEINALIAKHSSPEHTDHKMMHTLKLSMLHYDEILFNNFVDPFIAENGLEVTFKQVFMPFLRQIGYLWQTNAICPAQEHFISNLVRQKMFAQIELASANPPTKQTTYVLYLPELEIHEISLIMMQFILRQNGYKTIFLGQSVPMEDLLEVQSRLGDVMFASIFTTNPPAVLAEDYLKKLVHLFDHTESFFHVTGYNLRDIKTPDIHHIQIHPNMEAMLHNLLQAE